MASYLFTWNPKHWQWPEGALQRTIEEVNEKGSVTKRWSCGRTRQIRGGDRAFLIRLGVEPKGIVASGRVLSEAPYKENHWDPAKAALGKPALYVDIELDALLDAEEAVFKRAWLDEPPFQEMHWDSQSSGIRIREPIDQALEQAWVAFLETGAAPGEVVREPQKRYEGAVRQVLLTRYERDPAARARCIEHFGATCQVCEMDFGKTYGKPGFIHVHHLVPLAEVGSEYEVIPAEHLRPVCPNCHAVIHMRKPPYRIEEVKAMMAANQQRAPDPPKN